MTARASSAVAVGGTTGPRPSGTWATRISDRRLMPRSSPRKSATNSLAGSRSRSSGGTDLLEHAADVEDGDAVGQLDRLVDVVGDEHDRLVDAALQVEQLVLQPGPHDRVDRRVGLVHEQHRRVGRQGAGHADPLLLPAGQRGRVAAEQARLEVEQRGQLVDPGVDAVLGPAEELGDRGDVVAHLAVREQARLLDHVADAPAQLVDRQACGCRCPRATPSRRSARRGG